VRKGVDRGRDPGYFDNKIDEYRKQLVKLVEQRRVTRFLEQQKKNYKEILRAHRSQDLGGDSYEKKRLVDYGKRLLEDFDTSNIVRDRLACVVKTLQNNGAFREQAYRVTSHVKQHGQEYDISADDFETFSGNELQHYFHNQVLQALDRGFVVCPSDLKTLSIGTLKCAYVANITQEYSLTNACLDFYDSALYMINRMGSGIAQCKIDVQRAINFLCGNGEFPINPIS
jgi:hypothetical protein